MPVNIRRLISRAPAVWVRAWLRVLGPPFIALTAVVSLLAGAIAFRETGMLNIRLWILSAAGLICIHFGTSCLNDYFDFLSGTDTINPTPTPFSGGSRVIQDGSLTPHALLTAACAAITIGAIIDIYLAFLKGLPVLLLGIAGIFFAVGYVQPQINLSKRGFGELAVGLSFGPIMLSGVYYVQTQRINPEIVLIGIVMGLLASGVLWINQIPDYEADKTTGKTNWVVRVGKKKASRIFVIMFSLVYASTALLISRNIVPRTGWVVFLTALPAVKACGIAVKNFNDVEALLPANALAIAVTIIFGLLLSLVFLFAGKPFF